LIINVKFITAIVIMSFQKGQVVIFDEKLVFRGKNIMLKEFKGFA